MCQENNTCKEQKSFPLPFFVVRNVDCIPDVMDYSLMTFGNTTFFPQAFHLSQHQDKLCYFYPRGDICLPTIKERKYEK